MIQEVLRVQVLPEVVGELNSAEMELAIQMKMEFRVLQIV